MASEDRLRRATFEDAAGIAAIHVAGWQATYPGLVPEPVLAAFTLGQQAPRWRERLASPESRTWVIEATGRTLGFVSVGPERPEPGEIARPEVGEVYAIYVDPAAIGTGRGRALMEAGSADLAAQGFRELVLWVLERNERARRFYERMGLRTDGGHKEGAHIAPGIAELRYRRSLV